jgi:hypothetical protein
LLDDDVVDGIPIPTTRRGLPQPMLLPIRAPREHPRECN